MIVAATNVTILFEFTIMTTMSNVSKVTLAHLLPFCLRYQHYPCCYGQYVYLDYKLISVSMVPVVKRTAPTISVRKIL